MAGLCLFASPLLSACGADGDDPTRVSARWNPGEGELGAFPDDALTQDDPTSRTGLRLDVAPERYTLLRDLPELFRSIFRDLPLLDGFGVTAGMFLRFTGPLDPTTVPDVATSTTPATSVALVVEEPSGPKLWPIEVHLLDEGATVLAYPIYPLPPRTRAFLATTARLRAKDGRSVVAAGAMADALRGTGHDERTRRVAPRMAEAARTLVKLGVAGRVSDVAGAIVFTTQSLYEDAFAIAADVRSRTLRPLRGTECRTSSDFVRCDGALDAIDYRGDDGIIAEVAPSGPDTSHRYVLPFTVWLPKTRPGNYGGDAFPVLLYGHGLSSSREEAEGLAHLTAGMGIATVAIDAPHHGEHPTATAGSAFEQVFAFFGVDVDATLLRPFVMRDHFREATYDKLQVLRMIALGLDVDGDGTVDLDPSRVLYMGMSLGGIMGPELCALAPEIRAAVLVVAGGRIANIVSDGPTFSTLVDLLRPADTTPGDLARFFPVVQAIADRGDPAIFGAHLLDAPALRPAPFASTAPAMPHVLMAMVMGDDVVVNSSNRALAQAMRLPQVPPILEVIDGTPRAVAVPILGNLPGNRTAGLLQFDHITRGSGFEPATHSNLGGSVVGMLTWLHFLDTYLVSGVPEIIDSLGSIGRR